MTRRILVTRPDGRDLARRLTALGWDAHTIPTVAIRPADPGGSMDDALRRLDAYDWIVVTSTAGVNAIAERMRRLEVVAPARARWAAVGPATAAALREMGLRAAFVPDRYLTTAIAEGLGEVDGRRILLPRADAASPDLPDLLRRRGALVDEVVAYHTVVGPEESREPMRRLLARGIDAVIFTSGSTVRGFARLVDDAPARLAGVLLACIGPVTARAVEALGLIPAVVAEEHTTAGLLAAVGREDRAATHRPS